MPDEAELAIVLRGDLAAILQFAANKKNPAVLSEAGVLGALLSQESLVAGTRNQRFLRNGSGDPENSESPVSLVAAGRNTRPLRKRKSRPFRIAFAGIARNVGCGGAQVTVASRREVSVDERLELSFSHVSLDMRKEADVQRLPPDAFKEGANVRTAVVVFDRYRSRPGDVLTSKVSDLSDAAPNLGLHFEDRSFGEARLNLQKLDESKPFITRLVTGDTTVVISHDGRKIRLGFAQTGRERWFKPQSAQRGFYGLAVYYRRCGRYAS